MIDFRKYLTQPEIDMETKLGKIGSALNELTQLTQIRVKKLFDDAKLPEQKHDTDMGFDVFAYGEPEIRDGYIEYRTGIAIEIPENEFFLQAIAVHPRSSIRDKNLALTNSVGVIDQNYRGELVVCFRVLPNARNVPPRLYDAGDKIAQLVLTRRTKMEFLEVDSLSETDRGENGHGSTGK